MKNKISQSLIKVRLDKAKEESHRAAMAYIEIVTNASGDYMKENHLEFDPRTTTVEMMCEYAAKWLDIDDPNFFQQYIDFMLLEGMISMNYSEEA